jgi:hypothetical protein
MTVNTLGSIQRATTRTESSVDINKLRVLIAEHLQVDVRHVTAREEGIEHRLHRLYLEVLESRSCVFWIAG